MHEPNSIFAGGAQRALVVSLFASGVAGTTTVQLQHSMGNGVWENVTGKTAVLVNGWNHIKLNVFIPADAALMPLFDIMRLVYTSDGTGVATISNIKVLQES